MRAFFLISAVFIAVIVIIFTAVSFFIYPLKYTDYIAEASQKYDIDRTVVASVIRAESNFRPSAVSPKGATGLMQLMPETAEFIATRLNMTEFDLTDPRTSILMGTYYLRYLLDRFGDLRTALMAYNAGEGRVSGWLNGAARLETTPYPETNAYVERVLNARAYYRFRL